MSAELLAAFLKRLAGRLPPKRLAWIEELADVGEPELAIQLVSENLEAGELALDPGERTELNDLAARFQVDLEKLAKSREIAEFEFVREPRGEKLRGLIAAGSAWCDRFTFELSGMELDDRAHAVIAALEPFLISCVEAFETPSGTELSDAVTLCTYRLTYESARILEGAADRLYDWVEPQLPQDLCLLRGSQPWLINLAADRAAFLMVTPGEAAALGSGGLKLRRAPT